MENHENDKINIALMAQDISNIKTSMEKIQHTLEVVLEKYVQRDELEARFSRLQTEIDKRFDGVHTRVNEKVTIEKFDTVVGDVKKDIEEFSDDKKWLWRTVFGAILLAVGSLLFK